MTQERAAHLHVVECENCERLKRSLDAALIDLQNAEVDLRVARKERDDARNFKDKERKKRRNQDLELLKKDPLYPTAERIWQFWRDKCSPTARTFGPERISLVYDRLRDVTPAGEQAYTPRYICEAILGAKVDPYIDPKRKAHNGLELICRNGGKLESFHDRWVAHQARHAARGQS